jgi:hypothetical protein
MMNIYMDGDEDRDRDGDEDRDQDGDEDRDQDGDEDRDQDGDEDRDQDGDEDRDQDGHEDRDQDGDEELVVPSLAFESSFPFLLSDRFCIFVFGSSCSLMFSGRVLYFCFQNEFSLFAFKTSF